METVETPYVNTRRLTWYTDIQAGAEVTYTVLDEDSLAWISPGPWGQDRNVRIKNPDWKVKVSKRQDASTRYERRTTVGRCPFVAVTSYIPASLIQQFDRRVRSEWVYWPYLLDIVGDNHTDQVIMDKANSNIRRFFEERQETARALVPIAEIAELRGTIMSATQTTITLLQDLVRLRRKRLTLKEYSRAAAEYWLVWSFVIKPTVSDIKSISNSIASYFNREDVARKKSSFLKKWHATKDVSGLSDGYSNFRYRWEVEYEWRYTLSAGHKMALESSNDYSLATHLGLTPPNAVSAVWEYMAFSWIADYFGTVGTWLDDTFGSHPTPFYLTESRLYKVSGVCSPLVEPVSNPPAGYQYQWSGTKGSFSYVSYTRTPLSHLPGRALRFKTLRESGKNGLNRLFNLLAVLRIVRQ